MSIKKEEFNEKIFTRINDLINEYELIKEGEKIAIALSGGKDSVLTLYALKNYHDICGFDFELVAISVDEGIEGYRQHGIDAAVNNAKMLDIPLIQKSLRMRKDLHWMTFILILKALAFHVESLEEIS